MCCHLSRHCCAVEHAFEKGLLMMKTLPCAETFLRKLVQSLLPTTRKACLVKMGVKAMPMKARYAYEKKVKKAMKEKGAPKAKAALRKKPAKKDKDRFFWCTFQT